MYSFYNNGINWVQGEAGARAWMVSPNSSTLLMDSEEQKFYIKTADGSGMPKLRTFEYREITHAEVQNSPFNGSDAQIITKEEWNALLSEIDALKKQIGGNNEPVIQTTKRKSDDGGV